MPLSLRGWALSIATLWIGLGVAAAFYSNLHGIPTAVAASVVPAFLLEITLYVLTGNEAWREEIARRFSGNALTLALVAAAIAPYLLATAPSGVFSLKSMLIVAAMAAAAALWYRIAPVNSVWADLGFLALMASAILGKAFEPLYPAPANKVALSALGMLMWVRTGVLAVLLIRRMPGINFGLIPAKAEWAIGARQFLWFLPFGLILSTVLQFTPWPPEPPVWRDLPLSIATFFGMLWVTALSEEFFFRGMLQQRLVQAFGSRTGWIAASLIFGLVHLPFRAFPNWRFAALAFVAGLFYGRAYQQASGIRAAMVTHALVNTMWRVFLT